MCPVAGMAPLCMLLGVALCAIGGSVCSFAEAAAWVLQPTPLRPMMRDNCAERLIKIPFHSSMYGCDQDYTKSRLTKRILLITPSKYHTLSNFNCSISCAC
jgi:hypothetical protein